MIFICTKGRVGLAPPEYYVIPAEAGIQVGIEDEAGFAILFVQFQVSGSFL